MNTILNKVKTLASLLMVLTFLTAVTVSSCTTKDKGSVMENVDEGSDSEEHPTDSVSNAAESEEHPTDSEDSDEGGEHPNDDEDSDEHPEGDEDGEEEHPTE